LAVLPNSDDLTPAQVAQRTGRPLKTVQEWLRRGRLRGYKQGPKLWYVPVAALEELCRPNDVAERSARRQRASSARRRREDDRLREIGVLG
jgi:excisionase family DNA binding protein